MPRLIGGYPRNLFRLAIVSIPSPFRQAVTGSNPNREILMKAAVARKPLIRVAVVESDPLRFVGFRALFDTEPDLELVSASLADLGQLQAIDLVLLGNRGGQNLYDIMASMKAIRPDLRIIVTGSGMDDESVLKAIASGAKGYVDEAAAPAEFIQALRIVHQGSVWAPRRVLSTFIERVSTSPGRIFPAGRITFTDREKGST